MEINTCAIKELMNHSEISHGIDHLTINLRKVMPELHNILLKLDLDNSNTKIKVIDGYPISFVKGVSRNGYLLNMTISIRNIPYTIFQYLEYPEKKKQIFKSEGCFTFYSTYFRLLERNDLDKYFIYAFLGDFYRDFKEFPISRMDYRIDFLFKEDHPFPNREYITNMRKDTKYSVFQLENFKEGKKLNKYAYYSKGGVITGRTCGSKTNKSVYLRMYDKLIDSLEKGKFALYDDYFLYKKVYRLECEFRTKFNKRKKNNGEEKYVSYHFNERSLLVKKCLAYFGLIDTDTKNFVYQYKSNKEIDEILDTRYLNDFGGRACSLALKGMNPFKVILGQFITRETIRRQIKKRLLETLLLEFDQCKEFLISKVGIFRSKKKKDEYYTG